MFLVALFSIGLYIGRNGWDHGDRLVDDLTISYMKLNISNLEISNSELKHRINMLETSNAELKTELARLREAVGVLNQRVAKWSLEP